MAQSILEVKGLVTRVAGYTILDNLDFSVEERELRVLLGPNGAGKTTLIDMISGRYNPTRGRIFFDGRNITRWPPHKVFACGVTRKFQVPNLYETLSVYDNVMISLAGYRRLFACIGHRHTPADDERVWEVLEFVGLAEKALDPADTLSHGERQWLELGMIMAARPKLLLLDEPTTGMTEAGKLKTVDLISRMAEQHAILLVEHDIHVVRQLARKVTVLHQGKVIAEGTLDEITANPEVQEVYLGKGGRRAA